MAKNQILLRLFNILSFYLLSNLIAVHAEGGNGNAKSDTFDFVVVGGGVAGCVIASRLSENGKFRVLLLEAGSEPDPALDIPAFRGRLMHSHSKHIKSVSSYDFGLGKFRPISYTVGRTLGGGSAVNRMCFTRGSPHDYDNWANITGDPSLSYKNLLKYFKKIVDYKVDDVPFNEQFHGRGGPINIEGPKYAPGLKEWLQAGKELGYPLYDQNGPERIGFAPIEFSKKLGRRVSSYTGYIKPYLNRPNLKVIVKAEVTKVIFEGQSVTGVEYRNVLSAVGANVTVYGEKFTVNARREVILTAGVIYSPAILMRSGIGPKEILESAGISPVKISPVGMNLHDHAALSLDFVISNFSVAYNPEKELTPQNFALYNKTGEGPYSTISAVVGHAFLASHLSTRNGIQNWTDILVSAQFATFSTFDNGPFGNKLRETIMKTTKPGEVVISARVRLTRPQSRGRLTVNLSDIYGDPIVDMQYLKNPDDLEGLLDAVKQTVRIYEEAPALQKLGAKYPSVPLKECAEIQFNTNDYWRCHIKHTASSSVHAVGTCRMGKEDDPNAVVDTRLNVIGVKKLRVADAAVIIDVPNVYIMASVYVIAEKAADMILEDNNKNESAN